MQFVLLLIISKLPSPSTMVRSVVSTGHLRYSFHPDWYRDGNHKSTFFDLPDLPTRLRCRLPRSTGRKYGLCNIRLHLLRPRNQILGRSQIRTLHEDPTTNPLPRPNGSHHHLKLHSNRRPELDVCQRLGDLYTTSSQRLCLPPRTRTFQRLDPMGRRRTRRILRSKRHLSLSSMVLPVWRHRAYNPLALRAQS